MVLSFPFVEERRARGRLYITFKPRYLSSVIELNYYDQRNAKCFKTRDFQSNHICFLKLKETKPLIINVNLYSQVWILDHPTTTHIRSTDFRTFCNIE